jgi:hypothetical protein
MLKRKKRSEKHLKRLIKHSKVPHKCLPKNENESRLKMAQRSEEINLATRRKNTSTILPVHFRNTILIYTYM